MLIYSSEKEFIAIDAEYLKIFGFSNLAQLQAQERDFADFFVKKPGYIHNFQHVHWIDFVDCAESIEESQVMIQVNAKTFTANIAITTIYLTQSPQEKSYIVQLNNLKQISGDTGEAVLVDIVETTPAPIPTPAPTAPAKAQKEAYAKPALNLLLDEEELIGEPVPQEASILLDDMPFEEPPLPTPVEDVPLEIELEEEEVTPEVQPQVQVVPEVQKQEETFVPEEDDYVFDPQLASDELGLPIDLIEEFIEDFIAQAKEFEPELFKALSQGDIPTVASLSHKLKGVAGNLRIENAYDRLCIINTSKDEAVIKKNLQQFYHIVAQLAGEKAQNVLTPQTEAEEEPSEAVVLDFNDDDFVLDFKAEEDATELIPLSDEAVAQEPEAPAVVTPEVQQAPQVQEAPQVNVSYSKSAAASEIGLDSETFNELFDDYLQEAFLILEEIKEALAVDDMQQSRKKALLLKSMSESMYIKDLTSDVDVLIKMSDKNSAIKALSNLEAMIKQISK